jgi:hypothetical protein
MVKAIRGAIGILRRIKWGRKIRAAEERKIGKTFMRSWDGIWVAKVISWVGDRRRGRDKMMA